MPVSHKVIAAAAMLLVGIAVLSSAQSVLDVPQAVAEAVVAVGMIAPDPGNSSGTTTERPALISGSGFFVNKRGNVITALHVVRAAEASRDQMQGTDYRLFVGLRANSSFVPIAAEIVGIDEAHDLALLRTKLPAKMAAVNPVKLSSVRPEDGALIEAAGLPGSTGLALVHNIGHLADKVLLKAAGNLIAKAPAGVDVSRISGMNEFYLADAKADEGMSGGPVYLVDSGAVIGVVQGYTKDPRLAVIVPARYVIKLLESNSIGYQEFLGDKPE